MSGDKNIVTLEAANYAAIYFYVIKFLSKHNDKNLITFPIWTHRHKQVEKMPFLLN